MDHIVQIFNSKLSSKNKSPSSTRTLLADGSSPDSQSCRGSWSTVLSKVKECRNTIKDIMTFEKINPNETRDSFDRRNDSKKRRGFNSVVFRRRMLAGATAPDIITSNRVYSTNRSESVEETILISSSLQSEESGFVSSKRINNEKLAMSYDKRYDNDSNKYYNVNETSDSLTEFIALEKDVQNACSETQELKYYGDNEGQIHKTTAFQELGNADNINKQSEDAGALTSIKKKISAEPFISCTWNCPELFWEDDVEENFSDKILSSSECSNSTDITFDEPCQSSTFCEAPKKVETESIPANPALHDSGFGNFIEIMQKTF